MGTYSAAALLGLPVRLHSIQLARPVDLLVDATAWRALGFLVESSDAATRFLPFAASQPAEKEIAMQLVSSAENTSLDWKAQYGYIEDIADGRGYTAGIVGFCSGTGDMLELIAERLAEISRALGALQR